MDKDKENIISMLFTKLESNSNEESNSAKQNLLEICNQTRESWIVNGIIEYYSQTNSLRVVELLVKVQQQHDQFIFDKLTKMIKEKESQNARRTALGLFGHIIRKHPTWIHKVVEHNLMKEVMKLLKNEKDVVVHMSGLMCIITLLPIIPTTIAKQLPDLLEIFNYLAVRITNGTNIPEGQLVQLQYNFCTLFKRLYGMFPCNFIEFIKSEYVFGKDPNKKEVFTNVIVPMLENLRLHPYLLTASKHNELTANRWKKMEPHDVVMECARYAIESDKNGGNGAGGRNSLDYSSNMLSSIQTADFFNCSQSAVDFRSATIASANTIENKFESLWSPSHVILAQATPTPTQTPLLPNYTSIPTLTSSHQQQMGTEGTSPPEAAVEATPETTPMKPSNEFTKNRPYPVASSAARAIFPKNGSQPSSPMKKGDFKYPSTNAAAVDLEASANQKLMLLVNDRAHTELPPLRINLNASPSVPVVHSGGGSPISFGKAAPDYTGDCSKEDQEVKEITNSQLNGNQNEEIHEEEEDLVENRLPLVNPGLFQQANLRRRVKRVRIYSHCLGDSYSAGTSPADVSYMTRFRSNNRMQRFNSCPNLKDINNEIEITSSRSKNGDLNGNSSSPSDEALSTASHFKKYTKKDKKSLFKEIRENLNSKLLEVQKSDSATQTIGMWPQAYEIMFFDLFSEENQNQPVQNVTTMITHTSTTTTTTTVTKQQQNLGPVDIASVTPSDIVEHYIQAALKRKSSNDMKDNVELLGMALQYEKYRREIHAERNRRLLPKCRQIRQLEQSNITLSEQVKRLTEEIAEHNRVSSEMRLRFLKELEEIKKEKTKQNDLWKKDRDINQVLKRERNSLQYQLEEEVNKKKQLSDQIQLLDKQIFDLKNDLDKANQEAEIGRQCKEELNRMQCEMILLNEAKIKCAQKLSDTNSMRAREMEFEYEMDHYVAETSDLKNKLDMNSSQAESMKARIQDLEQQVQKRDSAFTEQKRLLQLVKDQYEDKFSALEEKYCTQKKIIVKMEEHILELSKNQPAVNLATSPESDRTDLVGSLDHTSPLSLSFASDCQSLSTSLRSTTEIRNLQSLVSYAPGTSASSSIPTASTSTITGDNNSESN